MNYMKNLEKKQSLHLKELSDAIGDFIRYWGFRRVHGQLWTQIYLSKDPLSGADLMRVLGVSKALVSPALTELLNFKLISYIETDGRTKKYTAHHDVFEVIRNVLRDREKNLIENAQKNYNFLNNSIPKKPEDVIINKERLQSLGEMISVANFAIDTVIKSADSESISDWSILEQILTK